QRDVAAVRPGPPRPGGERGRAQHVHREGRPALLDQGRRRYVGLSSATADVGGVVTLTFDDPASRNSLTLADLSALLHGLSVLGPECRAVVLTGAGDTFSSGANRTEMAVAANIERASALMDQLLARIDALEVPLVARVNGAAFGAGLALV